MSDDVTPHSLNIVICTDALVVLDLLSHVEHSASCLKTPKRLDHSLAVEEVNRQHRLFCDNDSSRIITLVGMHLLVIVWANHTFNRRSKQRHVRYVCR